MFDWANTEYVEWENDAWRWYGMRFKETKTLHGIIRVVGRHGRIEECTYRLGKKHGLHREIDNGIMYVKIFDNDISMAELEYDKDFVEIVRDDPENFFEGVTVYDFKL